MRDLAKTSPIQLRLPFPNTASLKKCEEDRIVMILQFSLQEYPFTKGKIQFTITSDPMSTLTV